MENTSVKIVSCLILVKGTVNHNMNQRFIFSVACCASFYPNCKVFTSEDISCRDFLCTKIELDGTLLLVL